MSSAEPPAFERAIRDGYLIQDADAGEAVRQAFRRWCREQGKPFVVVENKEDFADLIFDTGSVWEHFRQQYPFLRERPTFFTLDPTEELQMEVRRVINTSGFQGGAGFGGSYTWVGGLPLARAEATVQALLDIWKQAWTVHVERLQRDAARDS